MAAAAILDLVIRFTGNNSTTIARIAQNVIWVENIRRVIWLLVICRLQMISLLTKN